VTGPRGFELPPDKQHLQRRAIRLEWLTIGYMLTAVVFVGLTLGSSQAMKAAWVEDLLSLLPPIAFLVANRYRKRPPNAKFAWGYHRAPGIGYLAASLALLLFGSFVLFDSAMKLVLAERPPVGTVVLFGEQFWLGWLMLAALLYSGIPPVLLGRAKMTVARELHDKVLYADAEMNRADWMTASAAAVGVVGIGFGLWFADAVAGALIALDVVRDGWRNVRRAVADLMDARPATYDAKAPHPLNAAAKERLLNMDWVRDARVRLREAGHVFSVEAFVVPVSDHDLTRRLEGAAEALRELDWKLHDVVVAPVPSLEAEEAPDTAEGVVRPTSRPATRPRPAPR
jgi:divalent metal cation (Fe/Co/Zn/Cd) transporter